VYTSMFDTGVAETGFLTSLMVKESWVPGVTGALNMLERVSVYVAISKRQVIVVFIGEAVLGRHETLDGF
jgi:hypothetical protein